MRIVRYTLAVAFILTYFSCTTPSLKLPQLQAEKKVELCTTLACRNLTWTDEFKHCGTFIHECGNYTEASIKNQYSLQGFAFQYDPENSTSSTFVADREAFLNKSKEDVTHQLIAPPSGMSPNEFVELIRANAKTYKAVAYWPYGPNSNSAADFPLHKSGAKTEKIKGALGLHHYHKDSDFDEIKNNAVKLFYEYASSKTKEIAKLIQSQALDKGSFKNLNIGDNKTVVIEKLKQLQAFYVSAQNSSADGIIDLRTNSNASKQKQLLDSNTWNVAYDENGKSFWNLQLSFQDEKLNHLNIKSSLFELP